MSDRSYSESETPLPGLIAQIQFALNFLRNFMISNSSGSFRRSILAERLGEIRSGEFFRSPGCIMMMPSEPYEEAVDQKSPE